MAERQRCFDAAAGIQKRATCQTVVKTCQAIMDRIRKGQ